MNLRLTGLNPVSIDVFYTRGVIDLSLTVSTSCLFLSSIIAWANSYQLVGGAQQWYVPQGPSLSIAVRAILMSASLSARVAFVESLSRVARLHQR